MLLKRLITFLKAIPNKNSMRKTVLDENSQFSARFFRKHSAKNWGRKWLIFVLNGFSHAILIWNGLLSKIF